MATVAGDTDWARLADFFADLANIPANGVEQLQAFFLERFPELVGADFAFVVLAAQESHDPEDPLAGWRHKHVMETGRSPEQQATIERFLKRYGYVDDPFVAALVAGAGSVRAFLRHETIDDEAWRRAPSRELLEQLGVQDRMVGACPLEDDRELYVALDRYVGREPFCRRERDMLEHALKGTHSAAWRLAMSVGAHGPGGRLSRRQRDTLALLLEGVPEQDVAHRLGITPATCHQYVVSVYRAMGVQSRAELMAQFLAPRA